LGKRELNKTPQELKGGGKVGFWGGMEQEEALGCNEGEFEGRVDADTHSGSRILTKCKKNSRVGPKTESTGCGGGGKKRKGKKDEEWKKKEEEQRTGDNPPGMLTEKKKKKKKFDKFRRIRERLRGWGEKARTAGAYIRRIKMAKEKRVPKG